MKNKSIIYQILPRLWGNQCKKPLQNGSYEQNGSGKFSSIDDATLEYIAGLGVTYLWPTGVLRHATTVEFDGCKASHQQITKGLAGSPYSIVDYYDVNPYLADNPSNRMDEFKSLLKRTHDHGMKVLIDFVPNHVSRDYAKVGLAHPEIEPLGASDDPSVHWKGENDFFYYPGQALKLPSECPKGGFPYYENPAKASGNCFSPSPDVNDWYETIRLNYCDFHTKTWDKMYEIVRFWCRQGVDGFRCDMVEMVPWQFFKWMIAKIREEFPAVTFVAEVYNKDLYSLYINEVDFDLLYDKTGLYDSVRSIVENGNSAQCLTSNWQFIGDKQASMLNFLENHDEQRFTSDFFGKDATKTYSPLCSSLFFSDASFMLYFGEEIGERGMDEEGFSGLNGRTTIFDWWSVASLRRLNEYVHTGKGLKADEKKCLKKFSEAMQMAISDKAVTEGLTFDLGYCNQNSAGFNPATHFAFLRGNSTRVVLFVCNFSDEEATMTVNIPEEADSFFCGKDKKNLDLPKQIEVKVNPGDYQFKIFLKS